MADDVRVDELLVVDTAADETTLVLVAVFVLLPSVAVLMGRDTDRVELELEDVCAAEALVGNDTELGEDVVRPVDNVTAEPDTNVIVL